MLTIWFRNICWPIGLSRGWLITLCNERKIEMACHEVAALRLGLMQVLGIEDEAEKQHELAELHQGHPPSPTLMALTRAATFADLRRFFETALSELATRVAGTPA